MKLFTPQETPRIVETPIIPIDPAKATRMVLLNLENKLDKDNAKAVKKDMEECFFLPLLTTTCSCSGITSSTPSNG